MCLPDDSLPSSDVGLGCGRIRCRGSLSSLKRPCSPIPAERVPHGALSLRKEGLRR